MTTTTTTRTTRGELYERVLAEVGRREAEIAARPRPPAWKTWAAGPDGNDREYGPRYSPAWFGDGAATEAGRVRCLRAVYRLAAEGLIVLTRSPSRRLERVKLTAAGRVAVAGLALDGAPPAAT